MKTDEIKKYVLENLRHIRDMDTRSYTLYNKYFECVETYRDYNEQLIADVYHDLMSFDDLCDFMERDENKIDILVAEGNYLEKDWLISRRLVHSMPFEQNPGRNIKFLIKINDKIAGVVSLASDMMVLKRRDEYIGWTREDKLFTTHRLNNTAACSTIMPVQPLGYLCAGGKLISLLLYHDVIRNTWYDFYNDVMAGLTTTSLFGSTSQYCGMPKYWKPCDTTAGTTPLIPQKDVYKNMIEWLKENHMDEYKAIFEDSVNAKGEVYRKSTPKYHVINLFYQKTDFKNYLRDNGIDPKSLHIQHQRGVYFARFYENTNDFLCNKIESDKLLPRKLNFETNDANGIVKYWKKKWATRRFQKKLESVNEHGKKKFMMHLNDIHSDADFIDRYYDYDASSENLDERFASVWKDLFK